MFNEGDVKDNNYARETRTAYEKLDVEEIEDIREIVHGEMQKCNDVKRLTDENHDLKYPTVASLHKVVQDTERFPSWSVTTFRNILLRMGLHFKTKSETDSAILIEDQYIIDWRSKFLDHMEQYRIEGRPIHYQNESHCDPFRQPKKLLVDITLESADQAKAADLSTSLRWNPGRGNRILILGIIGPDGLLKKHLRVWIHSNRKIVSDDYHDNITAKDFYEWFREVLLDLPPNSVVVIDNASIHNTREEGTPKAGSYKADMQAWLMEKGVEFDPKDYKKDLWDKIKERLKTCPDYSIDKLAAEIRPDVIIERLP